MKTATSLILGVLCYNDCRRSRRQQPKLLEIIILERKFGSVIIGTLMASSYLLTSSNLKKLRGENTKPQPTDSANSNKKLNSN
jgi:hypothetical protein